MTDEPKHTFRLGDRVTLADDSDPKLTGEIIAISTTENNIHDYYVRWFGSTRGNWLPADTLEPSSGHSERVDL